MPWKNPWGHHRKIGKWCLIKTHHFPIYFPMKKWCLSTWVQSRFRQPETSENFRAFSDEETPIMKFGQIIGVVSIAEQKQEPESDPPPAMPVNSGPSPGGVKTIIDTWRRTTGVNLTYDHVHSHLKALRRWREGIKPKSK